MSYATYDFSESLSRVGIEKAEIEKVLAAWGQGDGQGQDAGHYKWAEDGVTDWFGGFLAQLKDGTFVYITGWCDYTGWGCQDGAYLYRFTTRPSVEEMKAAAKADTENYYGGDKEPAESEWDIEPADLNRWLAVDGE